MAPTAGPKETRSLEAVLKNRPDSLLFARLADAYRKDGNISRAIELCVNGLNNYPYYTTGRILLGRCYLEQQKYGEAIEAFTMVCATDRRNQMAIKMLADIFVKQGMDERAGGLYALLLHLDPTNKTLANLSAKHGSAQGNNDLYAILGIEQTAPAPSAPPPTPGGNEPFSDSLEPVAHQEFTDHTMVEDRDGLFPDAPSPEASPFTSGFSIDEQPASGGVSGGDIADRMTALFNEPSTIDAPGSSMFAAGPAVDEQDSPVGISGGDIADRMSALFGEPSTTDESRSSPASSFDDTPSNNFLSDALVPDTDSSVSAELSGADISDRIGQLFSDDRQASPQNPTDNAFDASGAAEPPAQAAHQSAEPMLSGQDFDLSGLTPGDESDGADGISSTQEHPDAVQAPAAGLSFTKENTLPPVDDVIELLQSAAEQPAPDGDAQPDGAKVSGTDVTNRIEEIFSDHDFGSVAAGSIAEAPPDAAVFDFDIQESPDTAAAAPESSSRPVPDFDFSFDTPVTEDTSAADNGTAPDLSASLFESFPEQDRAGTNTDAAAFAPDDDAALPAPFNLSVEKNGDRGDDMSTTPEFSADLQDAPDRSGVVSGSDVSDRIDNLFESTPGTFSRDTLDDALPTHEDAGAMMDEIFPPEPVAEKPQEDMLSGPMMQSTEDLFAPELSAASRLPGSDDSLFDPDFSEAEFAETMQFDSALFEQMLNPVDEGASVNNQTSYDTAADTPSEMVGAAAPSEEPVSGEEPDNFELASAGHDEFEDTRDRRIEPDRAIMPETTGLSIDGDNEYDQLHGPAIDNDDFQVTTERYRFDGPELVVDDDTPMPSEGTATFEIFRTDDAADTPELIADAPKENHEPGPINIADLLSDQPLTDRLISDHTEVIDLAPSGEDIAGQIDLLFPSDATPSIAASPGAPEIDVPDDIMIGDLLAEESTDAADNNDEDTAYIETMQFSREELAAAISRETVGQESTDVHSDAVSPPAADPVPAQQSLLTDEEQSRDLPTVSGEDIKDRLDDIFPGDDLLSLSSDKALLPEDDQGEVMESVSEFYTISGDDASQGTSIDLPDTITDVEFNMESETDASPAPITPVPAPPADDLPDTADAADYQTAATDNAVAANSEPAGMQPIDERDAPFTIPDHVLTPTLADIYFQQGQAHLALRIYERLLRHDPDNEKLSQRMEEICSAIERDELPEPGSDTVKISLPRPRRTTTRASRKKQAVDDDRKPRPLAGIHLKKQVKNAAKKARKRKQ